MDQQFKERPLTAFYMLLWKSLLFILVASLLIATPFFLVLSYMFNSVLGVEGFKKLTSILGAQAKTSEEFLKQSELLKTFLGDHPSIMPLFFLAIIIGYILLCYTVYLTQLYVKHVHMLGDNNWKKILVPGSAFLKVLLFLLLLLSIVFFSSGFVMILMASNPFIGVILIVLMALLLMRRVLVIPSLLIGEMNYSEAVLYSSEIYSVGKSFKTFVFGVLIFLFLSMTMSILFYLPVKLINLAIIKYFFNFWLAFIQIGFISIGMVALFLRYGNFEEEKITV